jgi:hypothetical protein
MLRYRKQWGRRYFYNPRFPLLSRLSRELGMDLGEVALQIIEERHYLLRMMGVY